MHRPGAFAPEEFDLTLTSLSHCPFAVGHRDGQAVLVRGGAPGDEVRARVVRRHARYLIADLVAVHRAGAARRAAPCPFHPVCGGCPWQQVTYPEQLEAKVANVRREMARLTGGSDVVSEIRPAPSEWAYRRRIRLHVDRRGRLGFMQAGSREVIEIDACRVAEEGPSAAIVAARDLIRRLRTPIGECEIGGRGDLRGVVLRLSAEGRLAGGDSGEIRRFLAATPKISGTVISGRGWSRAWGDTRIRIRAPDGAAIDVPTTAFIQVNEAANLMLVHAVRDLIAPSPADHLLELQAGAGNFTLALAPEVARLHAVERERGAASALRRAVRRLPQVTVEEAAAAAALDRLLAAGRRFDAVLADPPRQGLGAEIEGLLALAPPRLVVVSCDLATFARDARRLIAGGYRLGRVDLVDLFPQTFHIELVARLERPAGTATLGAGGATVPV